MKQTNPILMGVLLFLVAINSVNASSSTITPTNGIVYVSAQARGTQDGSSWSNAVSDLQEAIDANGVIQVWVSSGTYLPTKLIDPNPDILGVIDYKLTSFILKDGVSIYGGFWGNENSLDERATIDINSDNKIDSWEYRAQTILSGDIGIPSDKTDNSYHVIYQPDKFYSSIIIDGFTIRNGYALKNPKVLLDKNKVDHYRGGGVYLENHCNVQNCKIERCHSRYSGGGIHIKRGDISGCQIKDNECQDNGGGLWAEESNITNCNIEGNVATSGGGGTYITNSNVNSCTIKSNSSGNYGGGIYSICNLDPILYGKIDNTNICFNTAALSGGGLYITGGTISEVEIFNNLSEGSGGGVNIISGNIYDSQLYSNSAKIGGGISTSRSGVCKVYRCKILNNNAKLLGGGISNYENNIIENCIIANNDCKADKGGGIYNYQGSIINCTVVNNIESGLNAAGGGGIECENGTIVNTIVCGNLPHGQFQYQLASSNICNVNHCVIQGNYPQGIGNLFLNDDYSREGTSPCFVSPCNITGNASSFDELNEIMEADWSINSSSCCIDKGTADNAPTIDILKTTRISFPDIGAYEYSLTNSISSVEQKILFAFPNPFNDIIRLNDFNNPVECKVYTISGKLVFISKNTKNKINLSFLPPGNYLIRANNKSQLITKK